LMGWHRPLSSGPHLGAVVVTCISPSPSDGILYYCSYCNKDFGSIKCKEARHDKQ